MLLPIREIIETVSLDRIDVPSQVTIPERKILKYLSGHHLNEAATIVDLGSGAGSAALAIAEGMRGRNSFSKIHAYDWFSVGRGHFADPKFKAISSPQDASFLEDFKHFLEPYLDHVVVHSGDITKEEWPGDGIDLLHVDICKDLDIFNHIARQFFPSLEPGSFFIHQDFSRPRLPWLHYSTGLMPHILQPIARTGGSVFYRVKAKPSTDLIEELTSDIPIATRKQLVRRGIEQAKSAPHHACEHFSCLADFAEIYVEHWFGDKEAAKESYLASPSRALFEKFYPELKSEIAA